MDQLQHHIQRRTCPPTGEEFAGPDKARGRDRDIGKAFLKTVEFLPVNGGLMPLEQPSCGEDPGRGIGGHNQWRGTGGLADAGQGSGGKLVAHMVACDQNQGRPLGWRKSGIRRHGQAAGAAHGGPIQRGDPPAEVRIHTAQTNIAQGFQRAGQNHIREPLEQQKFKQM